MNVLSLFDGISCGQVALQRAGIKYNNYYASEIDRNRISVTQRSFPDTIQLGDVRSIKFSELDNVTLLLGGSPCENLSITAIDRANVANGLEGEKSILFMHFVRALEAVRPRWFLFENVFSMSENNKNTITSYLGVEPLMIDSALVSAQDRKRYYWTNIPGVTLPKSKNLVLKNIMETTVAEKYFYKKPFEVYDLDKKIVGRLQVNAHDLVKRVYNPNFKCATLTAVSGGYQEKKVLDNNRVRKLTPLEYERLQTLPDNYTAGFSDTARYSMCGDGWTVDVIAHILSFLPV